MKQRKAGLPTKFKPQEAKSRDAKADAVIDYAKKAKVAHRAGLHGVIASGQEAAEIRKATAPEFLIVTPGIRPRGGSADDHKRVATPYQAIVNGADYLVVGRPIIESESIIAEMQDAFDSFC